MHETPIEPGRPDEHGDDQENEYQAPSRRRALPRGRLAAGALAAVLLLGGGGALLVTTGGGGDDDDAGSAADDGGTAEDAAIEFAQCIRAHGIDDFPDPVVNGDGGISFGGPETGDLVDSEAFQEAQEACGHLLDDAAPPEGERLTPEEVAERKDELLAMAECVRDRGYEDFPDPKVDDYGRVKIQAPDVDQQVLEECMQDSTAGEPGPGEEGGA